MPSRFIRNLFAFIFLVGTVPVFAQDGATCNQCYSAQEAKEDLQTLYDRLREEHADMFARRSESEYDRKIVELLARIEGPIPKAQFHLMLHEALAFGNIGHAKTEVALADVFAHVGDGGTIIPLSIAYRGDVMITDNWSGEGDDLPPGSRIIALGGMSLSEFEDRIRQLVSADTRRLLRSQIEMGLPAYLYLIFGPVKTLRIDYISPDGEAASHDITAMGLNEMYALQASRALPSGGSDPEARIYRDLGDSIFYLHPGPFHATRQERGENGQVYTTTAFNAFVQRAFTALSESKARDLVIDLRKNGGGDVSFSDLIVARLVDKPYQFASRYEVRAGPNTKAQWANWEGDANSLAGRVAAALASANVGERVSVDLPETQPVRDNAFNGRVWVLIDRHSYSNAAVVAALMQDLDIATVMGEETADLPTTFGAVESFSLPNSGASIIYPKAYMVRASGSEIVRGVIPDFVIAPNSVGQASDTMLETAVTHILQSR